MRDLEVIAGADNSAATVATLGSALVGAQFASAGCDHPFALVPEGYKVEDLERFLPAPVRIREKITLTTALSFIDYWQRYADDASVIFADLAARSFRAVFDYHAAGGQPANGDHQAALQLEHSAEWKKWAGNNRQAMNQVQFASFIEDNILDVRVPAGAELLEVAKTLQAQKKVEFRSGTELHNGAAQLTYNEVIDGQAGAKGQLTIPTQIQLGLRIFRGCEAYGVTARLRYRIDDNGRLTFTYLIDNFERLLEDAFEQVKKQVEAGCKGLILSV